MSAPLARTASGARPFTVAWVPIGRNAGVATAPCGVTISPRRAAPSVASKRNEKASGIGAGELRSFFVGCTGSRSTAAILRRSSIKAARPVSGLEQRQQPLEQLRRLRRTAANMQINGYDSRDPADDRVAAGKNTAVHRTVSDRNHPFGVRRSIIRALECLAHVPGDRPRHEQYVREARRGHEVQPEAFEIIEGIVKRVDLELAAIA